MAGAVLTAMVLTILLPDEVRLGPKWLLPLIEGVLLVAVITGDPGGMHPPLALAARALDRPRVSAGPGRAVGDGAADRRPHPWRRSDELGG